MNAPLDAPVATPGPATGPRGVVSSPPFAPAAAVVGTSGRAWHGVDHYENFPVASWLVPARLRPAVMAIYRFARHADDIADEGDAGAAERHARLQALHRALDLASAEGANSVGGDGAGGGGDPVVGGLAPHVRRHGLDWRHFHDLVDAFQQDLTVKRFADPQAVDHYCRRSANPVGRLMLELFGAATPANLAASDAICSALQRINFLQDIVVDFRMDRVYLPQSTLAACGIAPARLAMEIDGGRFSADTRRAVAIEARRARSQLLSGRVLLEHVPLRLAWELRFVVASALHVLDRLQAIDHDVAAQRPRLRVVDAPALLYKALTLSRRQPGHP